MKLQIRGPLCLPTIRWEDVPIGHFVIHAEDRNAPASIYLKLSPSGEAAFYLCFQEPTISSGATCCSNRDLIDVTDMVSITVGLEPLSTKGV